MNPRGNLLQLYFFHATSRLDVNLALEFPQEVWIVRNYPLDVYVSIKTIIALDPFEHRSMLWAAVLRVIICLKTLNLCFITVQIPTEMGASAPCSIFLWILGCSSCMYRLGSVRHKVHAPCAFQLTCAAFVWTRSLARHDFVVKLSIISAVGGLLHVSSMIRRSCTCGNPRF